MHSNLRKGLLGTLFAGGLLAFGATAAHAADTTSGPDLTASALVSAATSANSTTLGLLGGSTQTDTTDVAAALDVNLGLGNGLVGSTTSAADGGTTADVTAAANLGLGDGLLGATTGSLGTAPAVTADVGLGLGTDIGAVGSDQVSSGTEASAAADAAVDLGLGLDNGGLPNDATLGACVAVALGGSADCAGTPGTTDPGTTNPGAADPGTTNPGTTDPGTGSDSPGISVLPAGTTSGAVAVSEGTVTGGAVAGATVTGGMLSGATDTASATSQGSTGMLARTGLDASLIPLALILLIGGALLLKRRRTS
ncbi:hypothetical protein [Pseudarthrobacter sulfonivorans]|uniref:hypothetical protein n=1 Tax=Pseudarthrobacter sulfonivorans TaxID=121292 RepID=UPI002104255F|nr:hypothetical protein [Pseudarthrobacter sulfonivorans]